MIVTKRDGRAVLFDKDKIKNAVLKAFKEVEQKETSYAEIEAERISEYISNIDKIEMSVESIQDIVEEMLMSSERKDVARAYVIYRDKRNRERQRKMTVMKQVGEKIAASNVQNQNANVDEKSFGGRMGEANDVIMKDYALNYCMSEMARNNHLNNEIYEHDLNSFAVGEHNCLTIPFDDLLARGFNTRQTDVRPANSINTAFQLVAVLFQLQSLQQFGGCAASHIDWTMVPYVRKSFYKHFQDGYKYLMMDGVTYSMQVYFSRPEDIPIANEKYSKYENVYQYAMDMTEKEIHQGVEALYHNLEIWA